MAKAGISGLAVFYATAGGILLWSGFKGQTIKETIQAVTSGNASALTQQGTETVSGPTLDVFSGSSGSSSTPAGDYTGALSNPVSVSGVGEAANRAAAEAAAAVYGWTGAQWTALNNVVMRESSWNNTIQNSSSGAFGIAQALGHGTSGTGGKYGNNYGGYGLSTSQAIAANHGAAGPQITWMLNYIKATYGSPEGAWNSEQTRGYY